MDFTHFDAQDNNGKIEKSRFSGDQVLRLIHRFDFNVLNRARIIANLGFLMYTDNISDMRLFSYYVHGEISYEHPYIKKKIYSWQGIPEHRFDIKSEAMWDINDNIQLQAAINFGFYWNFHHKRGDFIFMPQAMIGMKWSVI